MLLTLHIFLRYIRYIMLSFTKSMRRLEFKFFGSKVTTKGNMAEEIKKVEVVETPTQPPETPPQEIPVPVAETREPPDEKSVVAPEPTEETTLNNSEPTTIEKVIEAPEDKTEEEKSSKGSFRDAQLARVETEKRMSLIKAWEESEKCKTENKAHKKIVSIEAWENSKKAVVEAELRKIEENLEKKKAEYKEKMMNKVAMIHKEAEEKRAMVEAKRGEDLLKLEEIAAKCRATGKPPKKLLGLF